MNSALSSYAEILLPWSVWLPLVVGVMCFIVDNTLLKRIISLLTSVCQIGFCVVFAALLFEHDNDLVIFNVGGWMTPLGITLKLDVMSTVMLVMTAIITFAITIFSCQYFVESELEIRFWPLWWFLIAALNGIFISADIFNWYVLLELLGLSAVSLVAIKGDQASLKAAFQYLVAGLFASLFYLLGVALLYRHYGTLDIFELASLTQANVTSQIALGLITLGLILKTALFPLHFWLPAAHSSASAPVSAVLSALVVKSAYYILFSFWFTILSPVVTYSSTLLMGALGSCAIFYGSYKAFSTANLKLLVAFSTVAQIGYLFVLFPLMYLVPELAFGAVLYFIVAHGLAKAAMFMAAGAIQKEAGHDLIAKMSGIASHMPMSIFVFAITAASLIGLPPSGGFIAKWLMLNSAIKSQQWVWIVTLFLGGLFAAAYLFRVLNLAFTATDKEPMFDRFSFNEKRLWSPLLLSLFTVLIGLNAMWLLDELVF